MHKRCVWTVYCAAPNSHNLSPGLFLSICHRHKKRICLKGSTTIIHSTLELDFGWSNTHAIRLFVYEQCIRLKAQSAWDSDDTTVSSNYEWLKRGAERSPFNDYIYIYNNTNDNEFYGGICVIISANIIVTSIATCALHRIHILTTRVAMMVVSATWIHLIRINSSNSILFDKDYRTTRWYWVLWISILYAFWHIEPANLSSNPNEMARFNSRSS